ncbi:MDR family MFS transporter [Dactylosporangium sp. CA-139114]|uniref:MDR family MFS transporter n=1 Tax=Dactylosporangium sp. CA-139114 TaxID=3239931 RepID=UPI003D979B72
MRVVRKVNVRWVLLGVMLAMLLAMLDNMVVGTAMPTIVGDLGGLAHISWVVTAYTLTTAISTPVWGKLGDLYGRKHVFLAAIALFLAGSGLAGAAHSMGQLIGFRALQGIGAGGLGAGAFALIGALVPPRERGRYQGMTASVMAIGTIGGPLLGGLVTEHLGWRWAFYLNLPLGVLALVWCAVLLHVPVTRVKARIDWLGITLLTVAIGSLVLAATWAGGTYSWGSWPILALAAGCALATAAFVVSQRRVAEPVLPPRVFTGHRNFPPALVIVTAAGVVMFGCSLYLPLFQQSVQHASAANSGLLLLPLMIPVVVVSQLAGRYMTRTGRYKLFPLLGAGFLIAGTGLLATMTEHTSRATTGVFMALIGAGLGCTMQMATTIAQNSVEPRDLGAASAATNLFRTLGGSVGVAVFGTLFTNAVAGHVADPAGIATGVRHIFLVTLFVCVAGLIAAARIEEVPLRSVQNGAKSWPASRSSAPAPAASPAPASSSATESR